MSPILNLILCSERESSNAPSVSPLWTVFFADYLLDLEIQDLAKISSRYWLLALHISGAAQRGCGSKYLHNCLQERIARFRLRLFNHATRERRGSVLGSHLAMGQSTTRPYHRTSEFHKPSLCIRLIPSRTTSRQRHSTYATISWHRVPTCHR
jgi:hypothetical protein